MAAETTPHDMAPTAGPDAAADAAPQDQARQPRPAPPLGTAQGPWYHVAAPIDLADVAGRLLVLHFFSYTSSVCASLAQELERLAESHERDIQVIGVHAPRFPGEAMLEDALQRLDITQPVVADGDFALSRAYDVKSWPTLVVVSPDGYILAHKSGLPEGDLLAELGDVVAALKDRGDLAPLPLAAAEPAETGEVLRFPQGLARLPDGAPWHWALCDTGHNRVVGLNAGGRVMAEIGSGAAGFADGYGRDAAFNQPRALAVGPRGDFLVVADTGNHALRLVDPASGRVATVAGTGRRGDALFRPKRATHCRLNAPGGLAIFHSRVLFANAGTHQLATLDLRRKAVARLAGDGVEGVRDGPAGAARFAQPADVALTGDEAGLYVLDSAGAALRRLDLTGSQEVTTLVGSGVFDHGWHDGDRDSALMQHPEALTVDRWDQAIIADSLNNALRRYDPESGQLVSLTRPPRGLLDAGADLGEPRGLALGDAEIVVADTNNHRLRRFGYG